MANGDVHVKDKILLIAGCSHTGGSEIDGSQDSAYNRENSFGGVLAKKLGRRSINTAMVSMGNRAIVRSVLDWFDKFYHAESMDVMVLVGWSENIRIDFPNPFPIDYKQANLHADYYTSVNQDFMQINAGWAGGNDFERENIPYWHEYQAKHEFMCELECANTILQLQYFLNSKDIDYLMCNTMKMFSPENKHLQFYINLIDQTKYMDLLDNDAAFFWHYRNAGYENPKAKYWHHNEEPHRLFAEKLFNFYSAR
jgi:hypothetical protein|tara:strand:- start:750 stop:1511 length:762 start_codon:yes stop_codon:yes gene_type:complete